MSDDDASRTTVGIVGLGLLGGSLARGLKATADPPRIVASSLDRPDLDRALEEAVIDEGSTESAAVAEAASLVVYATPLDATLSLLGRHRDLWAPDAVLTDVVSLKEPVARAVRELGVREAWVGGHPMAGSEQSGFGASVSDLFRDRPVYLVREGAADRAVDTVERLWRSVGGRAKWIDAADHDRRMIWASHLPQLVANALASMLERVGIGPEELGPGGSDMTRLAGSSPELWEGLFRAAGEAESEVIRAFVDELEAVDRAVSDESIADYMERTRRWREGNP